MDSISRFDKALCIPGVLAILHGPLPLYPQFIAERSLSPKATRRLCRVRGVFHCLHWISLIFRLIHPSKL